MQATSNPSNWRLKLCGMFVFVFLGLGFGVNAWAVCDSEREAYVNAYMSYFASTRPRTNSEIIEGRKEFTNNFKTNDFQPSSFKNINEYESYRDDITRTSKIVIQEYQPKFANLDYYEKYELARAKYVLCNFEGASTTGTRSPTQSQNSNSTNNSNNNSNPTTNPLAAETQQSQQRASEQQARADQDAKNKGKRSHDPAAEASHCVALDESSKLFGGFKNLCNFRVSYVTCNYKPKVKQGGFNWSSDFDCQAPNGRGIGAHDISANKFNLAHTHNTEMVYWFGCKSPAGPADVIFVEGQGLSGRCRNF